MINFDRLYLERSGRYRPEQIQEEMARRIPFHVEYLLGRKTPEQIVRGRPGSGGRLGERSAAGPKRRPITAVLMPGTGRRRAATSSKRGPGSRRRCWSSHGEYDQFEPRHGHQLIVDTVNRLRPGTATLIELARADHELHFYASAEDAYAYRNPVVRRELFVGPMLEWVRKVTGTATSR